MPNSIQATDVLIDEYEEADDEAAENFTFVLGPDGDLKSFSIPQHLIDDMPEEVKFILEIYGIDDVHELHNRIIH